MDESHDLQILLAYLPSELVKFWNYTAQITDIRLVGGYVRDVLENLFHHGLTLAILTNPSHDDKQRIAMIMADFHARKLPNGSLLDIDMAATVPASSLMQKLSHSGFKVIPTGLDYGTITVILPHISVEITTLRRDTQCFGRQAEVSFDATWQIDAARRDFSINALYLDQNGRLYDYFAGLLALTRKKISFIGSATQRIHEDYLRILRYFRFCARYGAGEMDQNSCDAAIDLAPKLTVITQERIKNEFYKLLQERFCGEILAIWLKNKIFHHLGLQELGNRFLTLPLDPTISALIKLFSDPIPPHDGKLALAPHDQLTTHNDAFPTFSTLQQSANLTFTALLIFAGCDLNEALAAAKALKLSKREKTEIIHIYTCNANITHEEFLLNIDWHLYNFGASTMKKLLHIRYLIARDSFLPSHTDYLAKLNYLDNCTFPPLIIDGNDLSQLGVSGSTIGAMLTQAKQLWFQHDFQLTKPTLLQLLMPH